MLGQKVRKGKRKNNTKNEKIICKASSFKELRTMASVDCLPLLKKVDDKDITLAELNKKAKQLKQLTDVQISLIECLGETDWEAVEAK